MHSAIYEGDVWHTRFYPKRHAFKYRVFMMYLDLDELEQVFSKSILWSSQRLAIARFKRQDFFTLQGDNNQLDLDASVREAVFRKLNFRPGGSIRLLANLRYFGYLINPISCYYCFDHSGESLQAMLIEVTNTPWEERTHYVLDCRNYSKGMQIEFAKDMHVSPFMPMDMLYRWQGQIPDDQLTYILQSFRSNTKTADCRESNVSDDEVQQKNKMLSLQFSAGVNFKRYEITSISLNTVLIRYPLMTLKVVAAIYWQAALLFVKGLRFFPHPDKKAESSMILNAHSDVHVSEVNSSKNCQFQGGLAKELVSENLELSETKNNFH